MTDPTPVKPDVYIDATTGVVLGGYAAAAASRPARTEAEWRHYEQREAEVTTPDPAPMHCTEYVSGDPSGCARCGEAEDLHSHGPRVESGLKPGDRVRHRRHGDGEVVETDGPNVHVHFDSEVVDRPGRERWVHTGNVTLVPFGANLGPVAS